MSLKRIRTILLKDLRDAIRDARVLFAILLPLGIGLFYNFTFDEDVTTVTADVVYYAPDQTELPDYLSIVLGETVVGTFRQATDHAQVEQEMGEAEADLGLILPAGFDNAIRAGEQPDLRIVQRATTTFAGDYVTAAVEPALRAMAGQPPPAMLTIDTVAEPAEADTAFEMLGLRDWSLLLSVILMLAMIAMLAIPIVLAEETERRTLDALVMVASYHEVVIAKALLGIIYIAVMVPLLLGLTGTSPERPALFIVTVSLLGATLMGFGLLMAGIFRNANQLNTWSGIFLIPVIAPSVVVGVPAPDVVTTIAEALPAGAAIKLLTNSMSPTDIYSGVARAFGVILAWGVAAYALLLWQLSRRQA